MSSRSFADALRARYVEDDDDENHVISGKVVEFVGKDKVMAKFSAAHNLTSLSLRNEGVTTAGPEGEIHSLCPRVTILDISSSAFRSWKVVASIGKELPGLTSLDLSSNTLEYDEEIPNNAFPNLQRLVLNKTKITWQKCVDLKHNFPKLQEIHLDSNDLTNFNSITCSPFPFLNLLNLEDNKISEWSGLIAASEVMPNLSTLVLNRNLIEDFPCLKEHPQGFKSLTSLSIADNPIRGADKLSRLATFPKLISLRISPLEAGFGSVQSRMQIIPRLKDLEALNGSKISSKERGDCEKYYLKQCASELTNVYKVVFHDDNCSDLPSEFLVHHPNYPLFVSKYWNPLPKSEDGSTSTTTSNSVAPNQMVKVILRSVAPGSMHIGEKPKMLPSNFTIGKLKLLFQNLFTLDPSLQLLYAVTGGEKGDVSQSVPLDDDMNDLAYYCVCDGARLEMHERDLEEEKKKKEKEKKQLEMKVQQQLQEAESQMNRLKDSIQKSV